MEQRRTNNQDYANQYTSKGFDGLLLILWRTPCGNIASENGSHRPRRGLGFFWDQKTVNQKSREWFARTFRSCEPSDPTMGRWWEHKEWGQTLEALAFVEGQVIYAHVGDWIGLIRQGEYQQLTSDHSLNKCSFASRSNHRGRSSHHPQQ